MKPLIQVQAVSQRFSTASGEFLALQNVSFDIHEGETVSLIGHSGCGKSTLLNLIAGITLPSEGGLICDNREIGAGHPQASGRDLRRHEAAGRHCPRPGDEAESIADG